MLSTLIIALIVATILSWAFVSLLGWRRHGEAPGAGPGGALLFFFLVVFATSWVGGMYIDPVGPMIKGVSWLGTLLIGLFIAVVLAAAIPPSRQPVEDLPGDKPDVHAEAVTFSLFFWILAVGLMVLLVLAL